MGAADVDIRTAGTKLSKRQLRELWRPYREAVLGFRNYWYPACFARDLDGNRPKIVTVCGERLLLRRVDGNIYGIEDRCAHRRVRLSHRMEMGVDPEIECYTKDTVTCWYHGFTYDFRDGRLVANVTWPECPQIGKVFIKRYPVREAKGLVFVWIGDDEPGELKHDVVPGFLDEKNVIDGRIQVVPANWRWGAENGFDSTHIYMHRRSILFGNSKTIVPLGLVPKDVTGEKANLVIEPPGPIGVSEDLGEDYDPVWEVDIGDPSKGGAHLEADVIADDDIIPVSPELSLYLPGMAGVQPFPAPGYNVYESYVPIDETSHAYVQMLAKICENDAEERAFRAEVRDRWEHYLQDGFNNDDVIARQALQNGYTAGNGWFEETLTAQDLCIVLWRNVASRYNRGINPRPDGNAS